MADGRPPLKFTPSQFLVGAAVLEGILLATAFLLGWLMDFSPTQDLYWDLKDLGLGLLATGPLMLLMLAMLFLPGSGIQGIRKFMRDTLGPLLARCRVIDLFFLALLAGLCEEVLFRGFLFGWIWQYNRTFAVTICNLIFGMAHCVTPLYGFLAAMAGLYLTALMAVDPSPNLLIPITTHTVYDFIAFLIVVHDYRRHAAQQS